VPKIAPLNPANGAGLREPIAQAVSSCLRELFGVHGLTEQADFSIADHALGKGADDAFEIVENLGQRARTAEFRNSR
jgi:hypothetical protein